MFFSPFFFFAFCYLYNEKISVSLSLSLSTFQVINMGFLNEMWYKCLIQKILGCGDFFFFFFFDKAKDLVI